MVLFQVGEVFNAINLILPILINLFTISLIVEISITNGRIMKKTLIASFLNLFIWICNLIIYDRFIKDNELFSWIQIGLIGLNFLFFIAISFLSFYTSALKSNQYTLIIKGIKKTKFNCYYVIDQKDKIKDIADSLVDELGAVKEEILGKKIFDVFDRTIRIKKFNDTEVNNKSLREFYNDYQKTTKPNSSDIREIQFQNFNGNTIILNLIEQPIFSLGRYRGRMVFGEKRAASSMMSMERELLETKDELNQLSAKFVATLDVTEEGLFFIDLNENYVWGTDCFKKTMGLTANTISIEDLKGLMFEEDYEAYKNTIGNLTEAKPKYQVTYRTYRNGSYVWVKEHGKRMFDPDSKDMILGFVKPIESGNYEKSNTDLDNIKTDLDLLKDLTEYFNQNRMFEIAIVNVSNIPEINEKYGRNIGNIMLNEYTRRLKQNFNGNTLYRISGLEFVLIITDVRKMDMIKNSLESDPKSMDLDMDYGSIKETIHVEIGLAEAPDDGGNPEKLVSSAKKALNVAKNPNFKKNVCYYKEIK